MLLFRIGAVPLALGLAAGCAGPSPPPIGGFASELPWNESKGCETGLAPAAPASYDPRTTARVLDWVYRDHRVEPWCGCSFDPAHNVLADACAYLNPDDVAPTIVWAHVVPPSRFGVYRDCWKRHLRESTADAGGAASTNDALLEESARRQCAHEDAEFRAMEADLYNFLPAAAYLAQLRSDHPYGMVQGEPRQFGACDVESQSVMGKTLVIEPPADLRGDIARIYFYMAARYGRGKDWKVKLSREQRALYEKWAVEDPVDAWERRRACRIHAIQGWDNPFVK